MLGRVHTGRAALAAARACLVGAVVLAHAVAMTTPTPLRPPQPLGPVTPATSRPRPTRSRPAPRSRCGRGRRAARSLTLEDPASSTSARIGQVPGRLGPAGDCRGVVSLRMTMSNGSSWCPLVHRACPRFRWLFVGRRAGDAAVPAYGPEALAEQVLLLLGGAWVAVRMLGQHNPAAQVAASALTGATAEPGAGRTAQPSGSFGPGSHPAGRATLDQEGHGRQR